MNKIIFIVLILLSLVSCDIDLESPEVILVTPTHGVSVDPDAIIIISFSEQMNTETVEKGFSLSSDDGITGGSFTWNDEKTECSFKPQIPLKNGISYGIAVDRGSQDYNGNVLKSRHYSTFTIGTDLTPPEIISTTPTNNSTTFPLNNTIEVEFSETMDRMSVERNIRINPTVEGTYTWVGTTRIVFTPSKPLEFNTDYSLIIPVDCTDAAGNQMLKRTEIFFTAGEEFVKPTITRITANYLLSDNNWLDSDNYSLITGINRIDKLRFYFDEEINRQSFIDSLKIFPEIEMFYLWSTDSRWCEVNFVGGLTPQNEYELRVLPGTKDIAGNEMEGTILYTFLVNGLDSQPPVIQSVSLNNATTDAPYVDLFQNQTDVNEIDESISDISQVKIKITFSKAIDITSFFDNTSIDYEYGTFTGASGTIKTYNWELDNTVVTILITSMNNYNCYKFSINGEEGGLISRDGIYLENDFQSYFYFKGDTP